MPVYELKPAFMRLYVNVKPNASKTNMVGVSDTEITIEVNAAPENNKANKELTRFLSKMLGVSNVDVDIVGGATRNKKIVIVNGRFTEANIEALFAIQKAK